jgi:hypothetical protein
LLWIDVLSDVTQLCHIQEYLNPQLHFAAHITAAVM